MSHRIHIPLGVTAPVGLADLRQTLAWYSRHPKIAATTRGRQNIARLRRQIDAAANHPQSTPVPAL